MNLQPNVTRQKTFLILECLDIVLALLKIIQVRVFLLFNSKVIFISYVIIFSSSNVLQGQTLKQTHLKEKSCFNNLEGAVLDEVDVWFPDVSVVVQGIQSRVPGGICIFICIFILWCRAFRVGYLGR